jgi:hypothetical protein
VPTLLAEVTWVHEAAAAVEATHVTTMLVVKTSARKLLCHGIALPFVLRMWRTGPP